jgi:DNA-binding MarR family transcriptional regulator
MTPTTRVLLLIEELRKLDPELPAQQAAAFMCIAREEGLTQQKVASLVGASKSAGQRIFDKLGDRGANGKPGLGLIEVRTGLADARERLAYLTPKGRRVVETLTHFIGG